VRPRSITFEDDVTMKTNPAFTNAGSTRTHPAVAVVDLATNEQLPVELEIGEVLWLKWPAGDVERVERQQLAPERWQILEASHVRGAA